MTKAPPPPESRPVTSLVGTCPLYGTDPNLVCPHFRDLCRTRDQACSVHVVRNRA